MVTEFENPERICRKCHSLLISRPFKWYDWVKKWLKMERWELFWCPQCNDWCFDWYLEGVDDR